MILVISPQFYSNPGNFNSIMSDISLILGLMLMFFIVNTVKENDTRKPIYINNKLLIPFLVIFVLHVSYLYLIRYTNVFNNFTLYLYKLGLKIPGYYDMFYFSFLLASFLSIYLFGIHFSDFNWCINMNELRSILLASIGRYFPFILVCLFVYKNGAFILPNMGTVSLIAVVIRTFFYPALYEEFIYRGLLFSLLSSYKISFNKINIIQAVIFGFMHFSHFASHFSIFSVILTGALIIAGYTLGLLYIKTKSLMPCILLHALLDIYFLFINFNL